MQELLPQDYVTKVKSRSLLKFTVGLFPRLLKYVKFYFIRLYLKNKGVKIGIGSTVNFKLAKRFNKNINIGNHTVINRIKIVSYTKKLSIGSNIIIGDGVKIIMRSHNIHSPKWENIRKTEGLTIEDYVWLCPDSVISTTCSRIGYGAVVAPNSVVVKDVEPMTIVGGNPAKVIGVRQCVHNELVMESLNGSDFLQYVSARKYEF